MFPTKWIRSLAAGSYSSKLRVLLLALLVFTCAQSARAATVTVGAGANLQQALDAAQPGDTLVLQAGASFVGPFTLPNKSGDGWVTIQSSALAQLLDGRRVTPSDAVLMPKLLSPGLGEPALRTAPGAHHYRLLGLEISSTSVSANVYDLVKLGNDDATQTTYSAVPHHLALDRCYVHALGLQSLKRGIALHSAETSITNSHVSGFKVVGQEAQAIGSWNGPGPFHIINNYLEGAGEVILFGGANPWLTGNIPTDIEVRRNTIRKDPGWNPLHPSYAGTHWGCKNLLELKNARRVRIDGNLFENNWLDGQQGYAILFTPRANDSGAAAVVEDIEFTNNIVRHVAAGMFVFGQDDLSSNPTAVIARRVTIRNNLFYDVNPAVWGGDGAFLKIGAGVESVTVDHNTVDQRGNISKVWGKAMPGLVFTNNLFPHNEYGVTGDGQSPGLGTLNTYFPGYTFARNVIAGDSPYVVNHDRWYPQDNFFPASLDDALFANRQAGDYHILTASPYAFSATDGKAVGVDFAALDAAMVGATTSANPDDPSFFVRQHYIDFLNREPDFEGFQFWANEIEQCGADAQCREVKRVNVSAAFFLSIECRQTGYLVYRAYGAAFGATRVGSTVPLTFAEFQPDVRRISQGIVVGASNWQTQLEANKVAYFDEFISRSAFTSTYPSSLTAAQFVDALNTNAGGALSTTERNQLVSELSAGTKTRAQVLRAVAEDADFAAAQFNRAFVLMQYFGYLRRDSDPGGYDYWLAKLEQFGGDFQRAEMVKAFLDSAEYRRRFGQ